MNTRSNLQVEGFFDPATWTVSYIVFDKKTRACALVDSVLDYDPKSGRTAHTSADRLIERVRELDAKVQWILETHVHADHLSAAPYLKEALGGQLGIGRHITTVQRVFGSLFNAGAEFARRARAVASVVRAAAAAVRRAVRRSRSSALTEVPAWCSGRFR